jgi:hypothetical protein
MAASAHRVLIHSTALVAGEQPIARVNIKVNYTVCHWSYTPIAQASTSKMLMATETPPVVLGDGGATYRAYRSVDGWPIYSFDSRRMKNKSSGWSWLLVFIQGLGRVYFL